MSSGIAKISPDFAEWVTVEGEQVRLCGSCRFGPVESTPHHTPPQAPHRSVSAEAPNVAVPAPCHGQRRGAVCTVMAWGLGRSSYRYSLRGFS
jgi:hypothetical protein